MDYKRLLSILYYIGMGLVFLGVLMGVTQVDFDYLVLLLGSLPIIGVRIYNRIIGREENRRVFSILIYSSVFLLPAAWALYTNRSYWVVFIMLTVVLDFYASFRRIRK
ncbi:hypothetical protein [Carboxylicivirga linearis]|uniref:DUF2568 domain-containing protein n=1 Tax=Carboxylicivirga linearis TaxID=1628157 RepID=A0ABS5JSP8_9BACT|nr:hypothetical protein [Carboxylicivirga linearis]MBS2097882.1 hypothetical protein [Carboxylicivirga linearis]